MHLVKSNKAYTFTLWHEILWVLIFAIFSAIRKNKFPQIKITAKFFPQKFSIVWKYVFLLHVLNKNENIINAGYWVYFLKSQKLIPSKKNQQSVDLIAKISSRKTQKIANPQK